MEKLLLPALVLWSAEVIFHSLHIDFHFFSRYVYQLFFDVIYLKIFGLILIIGGLVTFIASLISFGNSWRIGIDKEKPGNLVISGIFSLSRNPIFLFMDAYFLGTFFIYPNIFFFVAVLIGIIGIHIQVLEEERFLLFQYGVKYRNYMNRVRRYL